MAASNRDVQLTLAVQTAGEDDIKKLRGEVDALAKGAGDAAPEFQQLASQIDKIGTEAAAVRNLQALTEQTHALEAAQGEAATRVSELSTKLESLKTDTQTAAAAQASAQAEFLRIKDEIRGVGNELKTLGESFSGAGRKTDAYLQESERLRSKKQALQAELDKASIALRETGQAYTVAGNGADKLSRDLEKATVALEGSEASLDRQRGVTASAAAALDKLGLSSTDLAGSQARVVAALNEVGQSALVVEGKVRSAAEAKAAMAEASKKAAVAAKGLDDAFATLGTRSVRSIQAEIDGVRAAMEKVKIESGQTGSALAAAMSSGESRIKELERELRAVNDQLTSGDKAASLFKNSMGQIAAGNLVADAIGYIVGKVKELGAAFIQVNIQAESMKRGLTAIYGSADVAGQQMKALSGIASAAGVSVSGISDSFVKFSAATRASNIPLQQTNELFSAVVTASATLGLGADQTTRAIEALGQMASKGVVSMEELRQQLGDALPGALSMSAKGMGLTDAELIKLVESGRLATRDFFPGLTKGLQTLQGDTDGISQSWGRFKTALTTTATAIGDAGFVAVLTGALKLLGGALGAVAVVFTGFTEAVMLGAKQIGIFAAALTTGNLKGALAEFQDELGKSAERINRVRDSFVAMADPSSEAAKRLKETAAATEAAAVAASLTGSQIEELTKKYQGAAAGSIAYQGAADAVAKVNSIVGDSALDAGAKWGNLSSKLGEIEDQKKKQIVVTEQGTKVAKEEAEVIQKIADLRGSERESMEAAARASQLVLDATEKEARSREALAGTIAAELRAKTELAIQQDGSVAKRKADLDLLAQRLEKADAEAKASRAEAENVRATTQALDLKRQAYADNSAAIDELRRKSEDAQATLEAVRQQFEAGYLSADAYRKAQVEAASAAALLRDAEADKVRAIEASTKAKLADNTLSQSALAMGLELAKEQAATAKRLGDEVGYRQAVMRQKEIEIQIDKLKVEAQRLEAQGSIAVAQAKMAELDVSDPLYKSKKAEYEATIKLADAKLKLVDAQKQSIDARQQELERIRSGAQALGGETSSLSANTSARGTNTQSIDANTSARERAIAAGEKELALKEREAKLEQKRRGVDENGWATGKDGKAIVAEMPTWLSIFNQLKSRGVSDEAARQIAGEFTDSKGEVAYFDNPGQRKYANGDKSITLGAAVDRAAGNWLRNQPSQQEGGAQQGATRTINITINGQPTTVRVASEADADALTRIIQQLTQAARVSK
jgi:tape measure domain-containing protein